MFPLLNDVLLERVHDRLIRRGEIILDLKFVYSDELGEMNDGRRGRPYKITNSFIIFLEHL